MDGYTGRQETVHPEVRNTVSNPALTLVYPMTAFVLYIVVFMVLQYRMRVKSNRAGEQSFKYFYAYDAAKYPPSDKVVVWRNHYANAFQVPLLFMIACVAHMVVGAADVLTQGLAWAFVASRVWHGIEHLGRNRLSWRPWIFFFGVLVVLALFLQLCAFVALR